MAKPCIVDEAGAGAAAAGCILDANGCIVSVVIVVVATAAAAGSSCCCWSTSRLATAKLLKPSSACVPMARALTSKLTMGVDGGVTSSTPDWTADTAAAAAAAAAALATFLLISPIILPSGCGSGAVLGDDWRVDSTRLFKLDKSRDSLAVSGRTERMRATGRLVRASLNSACFSGDTCGMIGLHRGLAPPPPPPAAPPISPDFN